MTVLSLGETAALAKKAARGAGRSWGLADEAGWAARWLAARNLPGAEALAALLSAGVRAAPRCDGPDWRGDGPLCPISTGAALGDHAAFALPQTLAVVAAPLLLLPFAHRAAGMAGHPLRLSGEGLEAAFGPAGACIEAWPGGAEPVDLRLSACAAPTTAPCAGLAPRTAGRPVAADSLGVLERFAARTYVPASEASRAAGAGAGLTDND